MKQRSRLVSSSALAAMLALLLAAPALAGGWAVVTLDQLPREVRAGEAFSLGFMVRQHGVTPIDSAFGDGTMRPILTATNTQTGARYEAQARKNGGVGHFVVDVTFPTRGVWQWTITPPPFEATQLGTLTVLPAIVGAPQVGAPAARVALPSFAPATARAVLRWAGAALLVLAVILWLRGQWGRTARIRRPTIAMD